MDKSLNLIKKIGQVPNDDLYEDLAALATSIEKVIVSSRHDLEVYRRWARSLSDIRFLISELTETKSGKKLVPLLYRFLDLEGKVKEMRNDRNSRKL